MYSLVDFQIFGPGKEFSTSRKRARKRFLSSVHSYMVHQLVLGLEWSFLSWAVLPVAGMVCYFRSSDVVYCEVGHHIVHGVVDLVAHFFCFLVDPLAGHLLLDGLPHVSIVGGHVAVAHVTIVVAGGPHVMQTKWVVSCSSCV